MQRRIEAGHREVHPGPGHLVVGEQAGRRQCPLIPEQFLRGVVLHVGHRVREHADVQRIAPLPADLRPDLGEQLTGRLALTPAVMQLHRLPDPGERRIGHPRFEIC